MLPSNCLSNSVVLESGEVLYKGTNISPALTKSGSPLAYVQDRLFGDPNLPEGAVPHLLSAPSNC